ncbi:hypothetical protein DRQ33_00735 [bacterium]|nr:MAG: hypothetical protein DRQ33_00735 [bacterium]
MGKFYIGQTNNLEDRIKRYNEGRYKYTKGGKWRLVYSDEFDTKIDAVRRECKLKSYKSRQKILEIIEFCK